MPYLTLKTPTGFEQVEWSPYDKPKAKFRFKRSKAVASPEVNPYSIDDEAVAILTEYYRIHGLKGPSAQEIADCRGTDALAEETHAAQMAAPPPPAKLEYGTPEFWKDWWRKKKEKEAKAAELLAKAQAEFAALQVKEASARQGGHASKEASAR